MGDVPTLRIRFRRIGWDAPRGGIDFGKDEVRLFVWDDALGEIESDIYRGYGKAKKYARQKDFLYFERFVLRNCHF